MRDRFWIRRPLIISSVIVSLVMVGRPAFGQAPNTDAVSREFTVINNATPPGACCHPDGACMVTLQPQCQAPNTWLGDWTNCDPNLCLFVDAVSREFTVWNYWPASAVEGAGNIPAEFTAMPPRPNPFTGQTTLIFGLPRETTVSLSTFDASGRRMAGAVHDGRFRAGWHALKIGDAGWPHGVYFYRLQVDLNVRTGKIILRD